MYIQLTLHVGDQGLPIKVFDWIILYYATSWINVIIQYDPIKHF